MAGSASWQPSISAAIMYYCVTNLRGENTMIVRLRNYLMCELPDGWTAEENSGVTSIYRADGDGALTLSYHSIAGMQETLDEHISIMAKKFLDENHIKLRHALILDGTQKGKTVLYGTGTLPDSWFIKLWVIAKYPEVVFATYQSEKETSELKKIDKIISSFTFVDV